MLLQITPDGLERAQPNASVELDSFLSATVFNSTMKILFYYESSNIKVCATIVSGTELLDNSNPTDPSSSQGCYWY
jgi:hypothetical protein